MDHIVVKQGDINDERDAQAMLSMLVEYMLANCFVNLSTFKAKQLINFPKLLLLIF